MKKRLVPVLTLVFIAGMAIAADKKSPPSVRVIRAEGKTEEFLLNPTEVTIGKDATWVESDAPGTDLPDLEFAGSDGRSLSLDLEFDSSDTRENVYAKFISSLESLTLIDPNLQRPPLVKVVWAQNIAGLPSFGGVVQSMSTKYTMFLPDGTPVRASCSIKLKSASSVSSKKDRPCP
jgi:hypothetical protein